ENRMRFPCDEFYVKSPTEMAEVIPERDYPGAIENTNAVADMIDLELPIGSKRVYQMPELKLPEGLTLADQLRIDTYRGAMQRYPELTEGVMRAYLGTVPGTPGAAAVTASLPAGTAAEQATLDQVLLALARAGEASRLSQEKLDADESGDYRRRGGYRYRHLEAYAASVGAEPGAVTVLERCEYE